MKTTMARRAARWLGFATLLAASVAAGAETPPATIPYAALYQALAPALDAQHGDGVLALKVIESKLGVAPESIRIVIRAKGGALALTPHADGTVDFPLTDALRAENPLVETNQPKGSLTLSVTLALAPPDASRVPAARLRDALDRIEAVLRADAGPGAHVRGIEVHFPPKAAATVTVRGGSNRFLMADERGRVVLMRDSDLAGDDTEIEFSQKPVMILPQR